jgi:hypothetical protein
LKLCLDYRSDNAIALKLDLLKKIGIDTASTWVIY